MKHPYNGMLFSDKKIWAIKLTKRQGRTLNAYCSVKKPYEKGTSYMIQITWLSRKGETIEIMKDQWLPGCQGNGTGLNRWNTWFSFRVVKIFYMIP